MVYTIPDSKMAEGSWNRINFTSGRARALIDALAYFENQRNRGGARTVNIGGGGILPGALNRSANEDSRQDKGQILCGRGGPYQLWNLDWGPFSMKGKR